jgi:hypothetical protein
VTFEQAIGTVLPSFTGPPATPDTLWYKLNETSGTTATDAAGRHRNGTLTGGATWAAGKTGNAVSLNGSGQYVAIPDFGACNAFTLAAWVKANTLTKDFSSIMHCDGWEAGDVHVHVRSSGVVSWGLNGAGDQVSTGTIAAGAWHHVAIVYDAGSRTGRIYINGSLNNTLTFAGGPTVLLSGGMRLGSWSSGGRDLDGAIDDFRMYNFALTGAQVQQLYNNPQ